MFYLDTEKFNKNLNETFEQSTGIQFTCYNNRCVKAKLEDTSKDVIYTLKSIFCKVNRNNRVSWNDLEFVASVITNFERLREVYYGKAQVNLNDGDNFDEQTGKQLAKTRLLKTYHKDFDAQICMALNTLRTFVAGVEKYCEKHKIDTSGVSSVEEIKDKIYNSGYKARK